MDIDRTVLVGRRNTLRVVREASHGLYLDGGDQLEALLPGRYIPPRKKAAHPLSEAGH
jgi:predicted RNA-binding protein (virulence factor B family)